MLKTNLTFSRCVNSGDPGHDLENLHAPEPAEPEPMVEAGVNAFLEGIFGIIESNASPTELDHVQVRSLSSIRPAPENDDVYNPIAWDDPEIAELAKSIKEHGLQEPILVSRDGFIISGHRRRMAALLAELHHVPVRVHPISRTENRAEFLKLLVEMNSQRIKSTTELLHESTIKIDPKVAHEQIVNERKEKQNQRNIDHLSVIDPFSDGRRCEISKAKVPLLDAIKLVLDEQKDYWPLSARQVHYRLLLRARCSAGRTSQNRNRVSGDRS